MRWDEIFYKISIFILGFAFGLMFAATISKAHAEQNSILCKTFDTKEFIDIVSKGSKTNDVLVQFSGGKFYDGFSSYEEPLFRVVVPFDDGSAILLWNVKDQKGGVVLTRSNDSQVHEIACIFR